MAIATTIQSMQTHTSNAYTMIGYGTDLTGINKNLQNLSSTIFEAFLESLRNPDTLFTNLPKKTGTGSNITLNDTANAPMRIELGASELTQDGTPTPSSPQDIHTISGSNKLVVNGINWFDGEIEAGYININTGADVSGSNVRTKNYVRILPNTEYTISDNNQGKDTWACYYDKSKTFLSNQQIKVYSNASGTFTTPNNAYYIRWYNSASTGTSPLWQLQVGDQATTYTPYVSQEADIDLTSKNLFDVGTSNSEYANVGGDSAPSFLTVNNNILAILIQSSGGTAFYKKTQYKGNETYTLNCIGSMTNVRYFVRLRNNNNTDWLTNSDITITNWSYNSYYRGWYKEITASATSNETTITIPACLYCQFGFGYASNNVGTAQTISNIQLEKGSTASEFQPYYDYGEYKKIGNYEDKFIRTSGKNLIPTSPDDWEQGTITSSDGTNFSSTTRLRTKNYYSIQPGNNYISIQDTNYNWLNIVYYDTNKNYITAQSYIDNISGLQNKLIAVPNNTAYFRATIKKGDGSDTITVSEISTIQPMINEGTTYGSNEWYIKKNIGKVVLDGSENWVLDTTKTITQVFRLSQPLNNKNSTNNTFFSNYFINQTGDTEKISFSGVDLYLAINKTTASTVEELKTWLSTHNTDLYYILATPTYTKITGTLAEQLENVYQKMLSYDEQTNISQVNNDLAFNMSVQAIEE